MEIEVDILDAEQVVKEADTLVESPANETALDAYFSILGNCPKIEPKQQVKLAAEYHSEVLQCQQVINKIPGKSAIFCRYSPKSETASAWRTLSSRTRR